jgi:peptidoglycan/LPS O-acetylase OafA/YrhL
MQAASEGTRTAETTGPPPLTRRADVQGLRAIAVIMVVLFHAGIDVPGGYTGVDVFFVISGFVITSLIVREFTGVGRLSFRDFYARRVRRILPASAVLISVTTLLALGAINPAVQSSSGRTGLSGSFFVSNLYLMRANYGYFDAAPTSNPLLHIWSLSVEEQFYLVFPALLVVGLVVARRARGRTTQRSLLAAWIGVIAVVSFALGWYTTTHTVSIPGVGSAAKFAFYSAPARAWEFAVGALVALGAPIWGRLGRVGATVVGFAGAALVGLAAFALSSDTPFPGTAALLPVMGCALLIAAGPGRPVVLEGLLAARPLTWIGDRSYSWYLWHWPLIVFASALLPSESNAALIGAAVSIVPAYLSYRWLEDPIRRDRTIRGRRAVLVGAVCVFIPALCSLGLNASPAPSESAATRAMLSATTREHATETRHCNTGAPVGAIPVRCTWRRTGNHGTVVLLGDSNAGHFVEGAQRAALGLGLDFTVSTAPQCPFVDLIVKVSGPGSSPARCRTFVTRSLDALVRQRPSLVVLGASGYLEGPTVLTDPVTHVSASTPDAKERLWATGLRRVVSRLDAAGVPTLVIQTVPQWLTWDARGCAAALVYLSPGRCGATQTREEVDAYRHRLIAANDAGVRGVTRAAVADFRSELCRPQECATNFGNRWLYKDGRHISVPESIALTRELTTMMQQATA